MKVRGHVTFRPIPRLPPRGKKSGTHSTGGWTGPRAGLDVLEKTMTSDWDSMPGPTSPHLSRQTDPVTWWQLHKLFFTL